MFLKSALRTFETEVSEDSTGELHCEFNADPIEIDVLVATSYSYKLVGDNIDKTVRPRFMRVD